MIESIFQDQIAAAHQRLNDAEIRHVTGRKEQGARAARQCSKGLFQRMVRSAMAAD